MRKIAALAGLLITSFASAATAQDTIRYDNAFKDAVAVWHMTDLKDAAGKNELKVVGAVTLNTKLTGKDRTESLAAGSDGIVAQFEGGYLDAGQGTDGMLNLAGSAFTLSVRLRSPSGVWGKPVFSKHGGHDRLLYNLFSFPSAIGFELGTRDTPDMTQVMAPLAQIGPTAWHTVVCRYDGKTLRMIVDGVMMDEANPVGPLRTGNTEPALIGGERNGGAVNSGWKGQIDYVALWNRALSDTEIARLSGGSAQIALHTKQYQETHLLPTPTDLYQEKYRPQFHFTARQWTVHALNPGMREEGWLNDVNGLIYLNGQYHLFAQRWARCWIHAVSTDLIHWTEVQPAFWDDHRFGTGVQSGGCVYDIDNTSGLSHNKKHPPLIAFWSGFDNRSQCLSYSLDQGHTWTKYAGNPYMIQPERDPKVFWYAPDKRWIMVLSCEGHYDFFTSHNLLNWTKLPTSAPDSYECPDFFQLPVDGDLNHKKWVLVRGNGKYSVGDFDGTTFVQETEQMPCDQGPNFYATMSWGDIEDAPGRRVQIAWMRGGQYPDMPFNQQMSFPCDMTLRTTPSGLRIYRNPAPEISKLHGKPQTWPSTVLTSGTPLSLAASGDLFHIKAQVEIPEGSTVTFHLHGATVTLTDRSAACNSQPASLHGSVKTVEVLLDRTSIETFVNDGEVSISACFLPTDDKLTVECTHGSATLRSLQVFPLHSARKINHK
ncbi:MAG: Beta-fructosidase, levanase/invertase [Chthonomonadaceae bacterium]|nr:Beta-fructosidase, levanase/invertase [Chthonomonadaceae bacterium]